MNLLDAARHQPWLVVYAAAGLGVLLKLLGDAYTSASDVCQLYPRFSFYDTLLEELTMHHTRLPLVRLYVPTLQLLGAYAVVYAAKRWGLLDRAWPLLVDLLSGRWLYHQVFEVLPSYMPFVFSEPDVPELLSEDEGRGFLADDDEYLDGVPPPPVDDHAFNKALAKLVQVKMQHANRTIPRPDDWMVFDPVQEKLVLQKHATHMNGAVNGHRNGRTDSKVSLSREQEPLGDNQAPLPAPDAECAAARREGKVVNAEATVNQPQEVVMGVRKRL